MTGTVLFSKVPSPSTPPLFIEFLLPGVVTWQETFVAAKPGPPLGEGGPDSYDVEPRLDCAPHVDVIKSM